MLFFTQQDREVILILQEMTTKTYHCLKFRVGRIGVGYPINVIASEAWRSRIPGLYAGFYCKFAVVV